jgi:gp16 family phage-associated protein
MKTSIDQNLSPRGSGTVIVSGRVRQALLAHGTSVNAWAAAKGFPKSNVYRVINEWIEHPQRRGRMPLGGLGREIITALRAELGTDLVPLADDSAQRITLERAA